MQYRDIVIHTNEAIFNNRQEFEKVPPIQRRVDLSDEIWLGPLESDVKQIFETCEPRVFGIPAPARQIGQLYSFVRELPSSAYIYHWDNDHELTAAFSPRPSDIRRLCMCRPVGNRDRWGETNISGPDHRDQQRSFLVARPEARLAY
jgi:hypothetical protein